MRAATSALGVSNPRHFGVGGRPHVDRRIVSKVRGAFDRSSARASEPCCWSCARCGALRPPPAVDPQRGDAGRVDPCGQCGAHAWLDLTEDEAAQRLATIETYEHGTVDRGRRVGHWVLRIGGAATIGTLCFFAATNSYSFIFSSLTGLTGVMAVCYFLLGYGNPMMVEHRALPYRWALPLSPSVAAATSGDRLEGPVSSRAAEPLRAPLSGRPCLGYRVVVRRERAPGNAALALVAQQACDLEVQGRVVLGERVRLDLPTAPVTVSAEEHATALAYLRRHGILEEDGPWVLEEGRIEAGDAVVVAQAQGRGGAILRPAK